MQTRAVAYFLLAALLVPLASSARKGTTEPPAIYSTPTRSALPPDLLWAAASMHRTAANDTFHLAWFSFDGPSGIGDAMGWTPVDNTAQIDTFFHVADGTELDGGVSGSRIALEGVQSLWCGKAPSSAPPYCGWGSLPGYGNVWRQSFESRSFATAGDVTLSYKIQWDSEPGYDRTFVEYLDANQRWTKAPVNGSTFYEGSGTATESILVSAASLGPTTRFRFRFESDGAWSDEDGLFATDGACVIDSVCLADSTGVLSFQDFEGEAVGALATADGDWASSVRPSFGTFAALYPGVNVLQEDRCAPNYTNLWGWFDDPANANYACAGHPEQGAWPWPKQTYPGDYDCTYLNAEIQSPPIPVSGTGDEFLLTFRVYRDMPLDNLQFYRWSVRSWVGGCPGAWKSANFVYWGGQKDWITARFEVGPYVEPGATHLQVAIGAVDMCPFWCIFVGCSTPEGGCRSHAPLVDDVHVYRVNKIGPQVVVRHVDLFQDNFADDGTLTGTARADMANDIAPSASPTILPGDSICVTASGVTTDPNTGVGPAVYCYVAVWPFQNPAGKTPADLEAPETRAGVGKRYPLVGTTVHDGVTWACFRMDSAMTTSGAIVGDRYCFDLNDTVFTPGDTVCYVLGFDDGAGNERYFSRRLDGQGVDFVTDDLGEALNSPMEFTILPAGGWVRGTDILYVDVADDQSGPPQLFWDSALAVWQGLDKLIDRYDVLSPSSVANNTLASRVKNSVVQIQDCYRLIIWSAGETQAGTIGDGTGSPSKSDDFELLFNYLDTKVNLPGLLLYGDNLASEWAGLTGFYATSMRAIYMNFNLVNDDHVAAGEPIAPLLTGVGHCFIDQGVPNQFIAYGGCPGIKAFDVLEATGLSVCQFPYPNGSGDAVIFQATPNSGGSTARAILSGFAFHHIRDIEPVFPPVRATHFRNASLCTQNSIFGPPVGIAATSHDFLNAAAPNPFNPTATIRYGIRSQGQVTLKVYNVAGQLVRTLVNEVKSPRAEGFEITWDGRSNRGDAVASGVYFYKLVAGDFVQTKKMVLLK